LRRKWGTTKGRKSKGGKREGAGSRIGLTGQCRFSWSSTHKKKFPSNKKWEGKEKKSVEKDTPRYHRLKKDASEKWTEKKKGK